jgi:hypothetical protein
MSYESTAEPIKIGYLMDFTLPPMFPEEMKADFTRCFDLIFEEATEQGLMDRPVQMIYREVEDLPKGSVKAVIDAFGELVDEACLVVFGPHITDNCVPTREAIEERFKVPAIAVTGTDDWLGEWTFAFPQGSMTDEPIFIADLVAKRGLPEIGVLVEQNLIGESYLKNLRNACRRKGIRIVAEAAIAQMARRLGGHETQKAIANMIDSGLDEQTAHDTYSAVSELVRGSLLLARMTQKHGAARAAESADDGGFPNAPIALDDRPFELLLQGLLRQQSQHTNTPVRDIAQGITNTA